MKFKILFLITILSACQSESKVETGTVSSHSQADFLTVTDTIYSIISGDNTIKITWPLISSPVNDPQLDSLIYFNLNLSAITGESLEDIIQGHLEYQYGVTNITHDIFINENGVFSAAFHTEWTGARMEYHTTYVNLNLHSKKVISLSEIFIADMREIFLSKCNELLQENIQLAYEKVPVQDEDVLDFFNGHKASENILNHFYLTEEGLTIIYYFSFPHFAISYEPNGKLFFSWSELNSFIDSKHPLIQRILKKKLS